MFLPRVLLIELASCTIIEMCRSSEPRRSLSSAWTHTGSRGGEDEQLEHRITYQGQDNKICTSIFLLFTSNYV